jgi:hypothetical protein
MRSYRASKCRCCCSCPILSHNVRCRSAWRQKGAEKLGFAPAIYQVYVPRKVDYGAEIDELQAADTEPCWSMWAPSACQTYTTGLCRATSPFWSKPIGPSTVSNRRLCPLPSQPAPAAKSGRVQPSPSSRALASLRSAVSKPSVNQSYTGASRS